MPTYRQQVEQAVDEAIKQGKVAAGARDQMIQSMAADESTAQYWAGQFLRADDYTRKTQSLAAQRSQQQTEIEAERARVQQERQQLEQWQNQAQAEINRLRGIEGQQAQLTAKLGAYEQLLQDYNLKDQVQIPQLGQPTPPPTPVYSQDHRVAQPASQWISREDASQALSGIMDMNGKALRIMAEHQQLFGSAPTDLDELMQTSLQTGQPLDQLWRTKHNVEGRQAQMAEQRRVTEEAALREKIRSELMSEMTIDPSRVTGGHPFQRSAPQVFETFNKPLVEGDSRATPESRPAVVTARQRIGDATEFFAKHFTPDGTPRQTGGPTGLG